MAYPEPREKMQAMVEPPATPAPSLRRPDAAFVEAAPDVVGVYPNPSYWWQNASFALPFGIAAVCIVVGLVFGVTEALGFGIFCAFVTLIMIPVVLLTWRGTATAIVLTRDGATALHLGKPLHELRWDELRRIERVEYLGNRRYKLVHGDEDRFLVVESEIEGGEDLVETAFTLSGIPRQSEALPESEGTA